jgi:hypothetical protein
MAMKNLILSICIIILFCTCTKKEPSENEVIENKNNDEILITNEDNRNPKNDREYIILFGENGNRTLNINDLFVITIPEGMELKFIEQKIGIDKGERGIVKRSPQYLIQNNLYIVFQDKYFLITIGCYGNANQDILSGNKKYNMELFNYSGSYAVADRIIDLKQNYDNIPFINENNVQIGKLVGSWPSGTTSDYYGLYFILPNNEFNECIVSINNVWRTYAKNTSLILFNDLNYKEKYKDEGGNLEEYFRLLELMEDSISFIISDNSIKIYNGYPYEEYSNGNLFIIPTIDNLRMRDQPSITGNNIGYMRKEVYTVMSIGEEIEIDGIKGNWVLIKPFFGNDLSWVFSGYTREVTPEEKSFYTDPW